VLLLLCGCVLVRCEDLLALRSKLSGLSVLSSSSEEVVLGICLKLPTARQPVGEAADAAAAGAATALFAASCCCWHAEHAASL
jgi:hypothetical protein